MIFNSNKILYLAKMIESIAVDLFDKDDSDDNLKDKIFELKDKLKKIQNGFLKISPNKTAELVIFPYHSYPVKYDPTYIEQKNHSYNDPTKHFDLRRDKVVWEFKPMIPNQPLKPFQKFDKDPKSHLPGENPYHDFYKDDAFLYKGMPENKVKSYLIRKNNKIAFLNKEKISELVSKVQAGEITSEFIKNVPVPQHIDLDSDEFVSFLKIFKEKLDLVFKHA